MNNLTEKEKKVHPYKKKEEKTVLPKRTKKDRIT